MSWLGLLNLKKRKHGETMRIKSGGLLKQNGDIPVNNSSGYLGLWQKIFGREFKEGYTGWYLEL